MKKSVTLALLLVLGLGPAVYFTHAEDGLGVNASVNVNANVGVGTSGTTTKDGNHGGVVAQIKDELHANLGIRAELVRANIKVAVEVFGATINRLNRIINRIDSRITKIQAQGGVTTNAEASVTAAKGNIADAGVQITAIQSLNFSSGTATTTLAANLQTAKADAKTARQDLVQAKQNLMKAVQALVQIEVGLHASATTTVNH